MLPYLVISRHQPFDMTHLEILCNLTDKTLEGELADKQLRGLLVTTNFTKGDGTRPEAMRLLYTTSCGLSQDESEA